MILIFVFLIHIKKDINIIYFIAQNVSFWYFGSFIGILPELIQIFPGKGSFFFFFFDLGFTALSRIFHLYRADRSSKVGENRKTLEKKKTPDHP